MDVLVYFRSSVTATPPLGVFLSLSKSLNCGLMYQLSSEQRLLAHIFNLFGRYVLGGKLCEAFTDLKWGLVGNWDIKVISLVLEQLNHLVSMAIFTQH